MVDVTVISCVYGDSHDRFLADWEAGIKRLDPKPAKVIVTTDHARKIRAANHVVQVARPGKHKQAIHLQAALERVTSEWIWIHDIDDHAFPDALQGIEDVQADVWQMGYERSDGEFYIPPTMTCDEVIKSVANPFVAGSCVRTDSLLDVDGFPDVALQDWALWRALARAGATFQSSGRTHFYYRRHENTRGARELTAEHRDIDMAEMLAFEESHAVAA